MKLFSIKSLLVFGLLGLVGLLGCSKNEPGYNNYYPTGTDDLVAAFGCNSPPIPASAAGAFYELRSSSASGRYDQQDSSNLSAAYAWFGNSVRGVPVSAISCAGKNLAVDLFGNATYSGILWYGVVDSTNLIFTTNNVTWQVTGDSAAGIPSFTYTDTSTVPLITLDVPDTLYQSNTPIICTATGTYDSLNLYLQGSYDYTKNFSVAYKASGSQIIIPAETFLKPGGSAEFDGMSVNAVAMRVTAVLIGNKTYYFVRESSAYKQVVIAF